MIMYVLLDVLIIGFGLFGCDYVVNVLFGNDYFV